MRVKIMISVLIMAAVCLSLLFAAEDDPLERLGNKAAATADSLHSEGKYLEAGKKYEEAYNYYLRAEKEDDIPLPDKINQMLANMVTAYYQAEDFENTIRIIKKRLALEPHNDVYARQISQIYERSLNDFENAAEVLIDFEKNNKNFAVRRTIGRLSQCMENHQQALDWYQKAFQLRQDPDVLQNIALLHHKLGNTEEAIKAYEAFIETGPREAVLINVYKNMGKFYEDIGNDNKSIEFYESSNKLRFNRDITLLLLSKYFEKGDYVNAKANADRLLQDNANNADAIYFLGLISFQKEQFQEAKTQFSKIRDNRKYGSAAKQYIDSIDSM